MKQVTGIVEHTHIAYSPSMEYYLRKKDGSVVNLRDLVFDKVGMKVKITVSIERTIYEN